MAARFSDPGWKLQADPFKDTAPIPQAGGLEYLPEQALGFTWAVAFAPSVPDSKNCRTEDVAQMAAKDLKITPLGSFVTDRTKCRIKNAGDQQVYEFRTTGQAAGNLSVGPFLSGGLSANNAYEVVIDHPTHVTFENPRDCLPVADLQSIGFMAEDRVCEMLWVHTVKQTKVYSRSYAELKADSQAAVSIIKIGANMYSSTGQMSQVTLITGNHDDITPYMNRIAASGYIVKNAPSPTPAPPAAPAAVSSDVIRNILDDRVDPKMTVRVDSPRAGIRVKAGVGVPHP